MMIMIMINTHNNDNVLQGDHVVRLDRELRPLRAGGGSGAQKVVVLIIYQVIVILIEYIVVIEILILLE